MIESKFLFLHSTDALQIQKCIFWEVLCMAYMHNSYKTSASAVPHSHSYDVTKALKCIKTTMIVVPSPNLSPVLLMLTLALSDGSNQNLHNME